MSIVGLISLITAMAAVIATINVIIQVKKMISIMNKNAEDILQLKKSIEVLNDETRFRDNGLLNKHNELKNWLYGTISALWMQKADKNPSDPPSKIPEEALPHEDEEPAEEIDQKEQK